METINITIRYDKKKKKWFGKRNQLLIKDNGLWREMTHEEQEKYHIIWNPEEFLYTQHN